MLVSLFITTGQALNIEASVTCTTQAQCDALINDAKDQISGLTDQQNQTQTELDEVEDNLGAILDKIDATEKSISDLQSKIKTTEIAMVKAEEEIAALDIEISELKEVVGTRMRVSQRLSKTNTILDVLSESSSIIDFIRRLQVVNHFAESDSQKMDELKELVTQQQALMNQLNVQKEELAAAKVSVEQEQANLVAYEQKLEQQKASLVQEIQALESERLSAAEIISIAEEQKKLIVSQTTGGFGIPLATGYVSCEYMCYTNHTGIDLANYGDTSTAVIASAAGTVVRAGYHVAYGNYVMITHNMGGKIYTTVYAHMHTSPLVSVGQQVSKGQKLGTMGNTGNSFGAHLHFEIYEGYYNYPYAINPRQLINFPSRW